MFTGKTNDRQKFDPVGLSIGNPIVERLPAPYHGNANYQTSKNNKRNSSKYYERSGKIVRNKPLQKSSAKTDPNTGTYEPFPVRHNPINCSPKEFLTTTPPNKQEKFLEKAK